MAIDLKPLWNFDDPGQCEQRFRSALVTSTGDDAVILQTQIARSVLIAAAPTNVCLSLVFDSPSFDAVLTENEVLHGLGL